MAASPLSPRLRDHWAGHRRGRSHGSRMNGPERTVEVHQDPFFPSLSLTFSGQIADKGWPGISSSHLPSSGPPSEIGSGEGAGAK